MVKEFELDPFADIWLVLDLDERMMAGRGVESVEEYAVTICASLAKYFLDENRAVGFVGQGLHLSPDRGTRQLLKIYEVLAFVRPVSGTPLDELLVAEQRPLQPHGHRRGGHGVAGGRLGDHHAQPAAARRARSGGPA